MKKKLISVLALVLVVCFVWVAEVDAADITYDALYAASVISASTGGTFYEHFAYHLGGIDLDLISLYKGSLTNVSASSSVTIKGTYVFPINVPSGQKLPSFTTAFLVSKTVSSSNNAYGKTYTYPTSITLKFSDNSTYVLTEDDYESVLFQKFTLYSGTTSNGNFANVGYGLMFDFIDTYDLPVVSISFVYPTVYYTTFAIGFSMYGDVLYGEGVGSDNAISPEQSEANQQIIVGIQDIQDILSSTDPDNQDAAESMSQALESGKEIVDEYSSLQDALEKPTADQLLPDYDRVVDGYVDTSIFDVFSTLYESGYIMFILLITCFFGVMSYALFGKKA